MLTKSPRIFAVFVFVLSIGLLNADVGHAAEIVAVGPNEATAPSGDWAELVPGQTVWYVFDYDFDDGDNGNSAALVELEMGTEDSVSFEVWTPEQVHQWAEEEDFDALGAGGPKSDLTLNDDHDAILLWENRAAASEKFYVIVKNERNIASYYNLEISGNGVSFPTQAASSAVAAVTEEGTAAEAIAAEDEILTEALGIEVEGITAETPAKVGNAPDTALAASGEWTALEPGEKIWYTFSYDYDQHADSPSEALVKLEMNLEDSVRFEVWTPEQVHKWANDDDFDPLGAGAKLSDFTLNDDHDTKLVWSSRTPVSETYYIIVENERDATSYFSLEITGADVAF